MTTLNNISWVTPRRILEKSSKSHPGMGPLLRVTTLRLRLGQRLLLGENWVTDHHREGNQRHRETDTRDAQKPLGVLVSKNDVVSIGSANGVNACKFEWLGVDICSQGLVAKSVHELARQDLVPDCAGNGVSKCATDIVGCQEETGNDGEVLRLLVNFACYLWKRKAYSRV